MLLYIHEGTANRTITMKGYRQSGITGNNGTNHDDSQGQDDRT